MKLSIGNPVQGEDFFDREKELIILWDKLPREHILMLAPRRIGKTSILRKLIADACDHSFQAADVCHFARCQNELDCVNEIIGAIHKNHKNFTKALNKRLKRIKSISISLTSAKVDFDASQPRQWREVGKELAETLQDLGGHWLIPVDELPIFVLTLLKQEDGLNRTHQFLDWFRSLRQEYYQSIHWVLAGSIGLDTVAARLNLGDTINDLSVFPLGAFEVPVAQRFLRTLADSYEMVLSDDVIDTMIQCIGWPVPYYLQLLFSALRDQCPISDIDNHSFNISAVNNAFESLLTPAHKGYFDYWRQRLKEELEEPDSGYAVLLLNAACHDSAGVSRETLQQILSEVIQDSGEKQEKLGYLLDVLENDGYLIEADQRYRFRLELLREYWLRRVAR